MTSEEFINNHSAFWQQNGFDFQFALFIKYLFECDLNAVVKYEAEDDIVIEHSQERIDLIQVKHSYEENKSMTNSNSNVWKTIVNWLRYLKAREAEHKPVRDIKCILVVNMKPRHDFLTIIDKFHHGEADYADVTNCLRELSSLESCKSEVRELLNEKKDIMKLISKIEVRQVNNLLGELVDRVNQKYCMPILVDEVLFSIIGKLWRMKLEHKDGFFLFRVEDFLHVFSSDLQKFTIKPFEPIEEEEEKIPDDYKEWPMVKQLTSVGVSGEFSLTSYFGYYWCYKNSINTYCVKSHLMAEAVREKIEAMVVKTWKDCFVDVSYDLVGDDKDSADEKILKMRGHECLSRSMKLSVTCDGILIKPHFSSGWMLELSNEQNPRVFWRADWLKE